LGIEHHDTNNGIIEGKPARSKLNKKRNFKANVEEGQSARYISISDCLYGKKPNDATISMIVMYRFRRLPAPAIFASTHFS
jgi:hypothetical protein